MALQIGVSDLEGGGNTNFANWFQIKANEKNAYRVLPPIFSNATTGRWNRFVATHSVWVTTASGKRRPYNFECIEEKDKSGNITISCPFCQMAVKNKQQYELLKSRMSGTPEEKKKLQEYQQTQVWSFQPNKKVYLNVISLEGTAGVLAIPYKCLISLKAKLLDIRSQWGQDPTGNPGMFLDFKKVQAYKGDRDTTYSVEQYLEHAVDANGQPIARPKSHMLDESALTAIEKNCKDLSDLFRVISGAQMNQILAAMNDHAALTKLLDSIFSEPTPHTEITSHDATGAQYVATTTLQGNEMVTKSNMPMEPAPVPGQPAMPNIDTPIVASPAPVAAPVAEPIAAPVAAPVAEPIAAPVAEPIAAPVAEPIAEPIEQSTPVVGSVIEAMDNDEFAAQFFGGADE